MVVSCWSTPLTMNILSEQAVKHFLAARNVYLLAALAIGNRKQTCKRRLSANWFASVPVEQPAIRSKQSIHYFSINMQKAYSRYISSQVFLSCSLCITNGKTKPCQSCSMACPPWTTLIQFCDKVNEKLEVRQRLWIIKSQKLEPDKFLVQGMSISTTKQPRTGPFHSGDVSWIVVSCMMYPLKRASPESNVLRIFWKIALILCKLWLILS
jgi:hypothetical protein